MIKVLIVCHSTEGFYIQVELNIFSCILKDVGHEILEILLCIGESIQNTFVFLKLCVSEILHT